MVMSEAPSTPGELGQEAVVVRPTTVTWRFLGERDAADRAYCARFGVSEAPEPMRVLGGVLAYALPAAPALDSQ